MGNTLDRCLNVSRRIPDSVDRYDREDRRSNYVTMVSLSSSTINDHVLRCTTVFLLEVPCNLADMMSKKLNEYQKIEIRWKQEVEAVDDTRHRTYTLVSPIPM